VTIDEAERILGEPVESQRGINYGGNWRIPKGAGRKSKASKLIEAGFVASWFTAEFQEINWKSLVDSKDERVSLDLRNSLI
jgi:hypothetical protein